MYHKLHKINLNRGGSYIDSPKWLKNKKGTVNPKNNGDKCFQYVITMTLNHEQIKKDPQRTTKIKHFIHQYNWKETDVPSQIKDSKKFESNNKSNDLNILYVAHNTKDLRHAYVLKYNFESENQVILLRISDGEKWHYLAVKKLSALLRGITSKHKGGSYWINCFYSYSTKEKLKKHDKVCENHDYCYVEE